MSDCTPERLPLLIYPGELSEDELHELRVHLTLCERCEQVHDELEAVAAQLDLVPEPSLSPAERRQLLAEVAAATDDAGVRKALDLVGLNYGLEDDFRASLREGVLERVGLAGNDEDLSSLESELGAALDLVATPALSEDARATLREGVLARVGLAADLEGGNFEGVGAALDLDSAPTLSEDARASLREGVLARVGLTQEFAGTDAEVETLLDSVGIPVLSDDARASLREGVLARVGLSSGRALEHEEAAFAPALDSVPAPALSEDARAELREGVLESVGLSASHETAAGELAPALDLVPAPTLGEGEGTKLQDEVLATTGNAPAPRGTLIRFPRWIMAAAAALLLTGSAALFMIEPWDQSSGDTTRLAFVDAEKLVRTADETASEMQVAHLAAARERIQQVVLSKNADAGAQRRATRELLALDALNLRSEPDSLPEKIAPQPLRRSPESFLRPKRVVLERYPESLAALYVLRRYIDMDAQRETPVASPASPSDVEITSAVEASLGSDLDTLRDRDADVFQLEIKDLEKHFGAPSLVRTIRQALLIQRGLHTARQGNTAGARAWYQQVLGEGSETRAAEIARDLLADLPN